jgi:hypothetical protein
MALGVVVAEGGGFRAAIVRAVGLTLTTLVPHGGNFKFVNDLPSAINLLGPHVQAGIGGTEGLARAVEELRARIGRTNVRA